MMTQLALHNKIYSTPRDAKFLDNKSYYTIQKMVHLFMTLKILSFRVSG